MNQVGQIERLTQNRIVKLFQNNLKYTYLGNWEERLDNSNIEEKPLFNYLTKNAGYPEDLAKRAINEIKSESRNYDKSLYENNKKIYSLLRYGHETKSNPSER